MAAADASSPQPPLSEQDVNVLLAQLGTVELSQEQKDHVRRALEAKKVEDIASDRRKAMQDFSMLSLYLGEEHWQKIMNYSEESLAVLGMVISFLCQTYGLRCPSEQTQAALTALLVARDMKKAGRCRDSSCSAVEGFVFDCEGPGSGPDKQVQGSTSTSRMRVPQDIAI